MIDDNMCARDCSLLVQSPDMQIVHVFDAWNAFQIMLDVVQCDARRYRLEQYLSATEKQRDRCRHDCEGDEKTECWIGVKPRRRVEEHDNNSGYNYSNVVEGVADEVNQDSHDAKINTRRSEICCVVHVRNMGVVWQLKRRHRVVRVTFLVGTVVWAGCWVHMTAMRVPMAMIVVF